MRQALNSPILKFPEAGEMRVLGWPEWAQKLAAKRQPGERDLPATISRLIGPFGSDAFKLWHAETFGVMSGHCNCAHLRAQWGFIYRY